MRLKRILEKVGWRGKLTILAVVKRVYWLEEEVREEGREMMMMMMMRVRRRESRMSRVQCQIFMLWK